MAARCIRAITEGKGTATDGSDIPVRCDSICIHSDTPNAIDIARAVRAAVQPYTERTPWHSFCPRFPAPSTAPPPPTSRPSRRWRCRRRGRRDRADRGDESFHE